nr:unnamed protein product [Callosobruchus chinensis]
MSISLPTEKRSRWLSMLLKFKGRKQCRLVAVCPAMRFGYLYTKLLEREKYLALKHSKGAYDNIMQIRDHLKNDVEWWIRNLLFPTI